MFVKELLKKIGFESADVESILNDERGEEITVESLADKLNTTKNEVWLIKNKGQIEAAAVKDAEVKAKKAAENTLMQKLKSKLGLQIGNVKEMTRDEFIEAAKVFVDENSQATDEKTLARLTELNDKYATSQEALQSLREEKEKLVGSFDSFKVETEEKIKTQNYLSNVLGSIKWAGETEEQRKYKRRNFERNLMDQFDIKSDGTFIDRETKVAALKPGDTGAWTKIDDYIEYETERVGIRAKSKESGAPEKFTGKNPFPESVNGKAIDRSASNKLAEAMGLK